MIVNCVHHPRAVPVGQGEIRVFLNDADSLLVGTLTEVEQLTEALGEAAYYLRERARVEQTRLDESAALEINAANEKAHKAWGATLTLRPEPVRIVACNCTRVYLCPEHRAESVTPVTTRFVSIPVSACDHDPDLTCVVCACPDSAA